MSSKEPIAYRPYTLDDTKILARGLNWLYETEQPPNALANHHGPTSPVVNHRSYRFIPSGKLGLPVLVVDLDGAHTYTRIQIGKENRIAYPMHRAEIEKIALAIKNEVSIVETWNGEGSVSVSYLLSRRAHPTLLDAVKREHDRCCEEHRATISGRCKDWAAGYEHLNQPTWPALVTA